MTNNSRQIAKILLEVKAVKLSPDNPFQWSSGWNSPIYCDNRVALSYPEERSLIKQSLAALIEEKFPDVDAISGVATAGIAQGALVADLLKKPFSYVRAKPKGHGMQNLIEGKVDTGQKVVLVEDLISTGGSSLKAVQALQDTGVEVLGLVAIFTYGFDVAVNNFSEADIPFYCLSDYNVLIDTALEKNYITEDQLEQLKSWRDSPETWGVS